MRANAGILFVGMELILGVACAGLALNDALHDHPSPLMTFLLAFGPLQVLPLAVMACVLMVDIAARVAPADDANPYRSPRSES